MTEQQPETSPEDLARTRAFQPIDPYGVGTYADFRPEPDGADAEFDDDDDGPYPGLRERIASFGKARAALAATAAVLVVAGIAWGTSAALASSDSRTPAAPPAVTAAGGQHAKKPVAKAARVTITALSANSFSGTEAKGTPVTVVYGDDTKFGNKARPLAPEELAVGMTVTVLGEQSGDTITATSIGMPVKKGPAVPGTGVTETPETPGAPSATATG